MKIVALDPGRTTGYAHGYIDEGKLYIISGQEKLSHSGLFDHLSATAPDIIICERFDYRNRARKGLDMYPRELIGIVELYCTQKELPEPFMQMPATVMRYFTDKLLGQKNLYKVGKPHSNDAVRHILYWFEFGSGYQYNKHGYCAAS